MTPGATALLQQCSDAMFDKGASHLGFPSVCAQSAYYVGNTAVSEEEVEEIDLLLSEQDVRLRNTRLAKDVDPESQETTFTVLIASSCTGVETKLLCQTKADANVFLTGGDHAQTLGQIRADLKRASEISVNERKENLSITTDVLSRQGTLNPLTTRRGFG